MTRKKALVVRGGWEGHRPVEATELFLPFLDGSGYTVRIEESTDVYADAAETGRHRPRRAVHHDVGDHRASSCRG